MADKFNYGPSTASTGATKKRPTWLQGLLNPESKHYRKMMSKQPEDRELKPERGMAKKPKKNTLFDIGHISDVGKKLFKRSE